MTIAKFRKKPVVIEAEQFTQEMHEGKAEWPRGVVWGYVPGEDHGGAIVETLEGHMRVSVGDWIIKGVAGEFYPCKPDIFARTYDRVESQEGKA